MNFDDLILHFSKKSSKYSKTLIYCSLTGVQDNSILVYMKITAARLMKNYIKQITSYLRLLTFLKNHVDRTMKLNISKTFTTN